MAIKHPCDVLAVIYAKIEQYPSSRFQVELLREAGLRVQVVEERNIPKHSIARLLSYKRFNTKVRKIVRESRPKVVIAYDTFGIYLTGKVWLDQSSPKLIWHFHEMLSCFDKQTLKVGRFLQNAENFIKKYINKPDLLTFPDSNRAIYMQKQLHYSQAVQIVYNCPRLGLKVEQLTDRFKREHQLPVGPQFVYFQGAIGSSRNLDKVITSMPLWQAKHHLVMIGPIKAADKAKLEDLARAHGLEQRVHILPPKSYEDVMHIASGAFAGLSLIQEKDNPLWLYSSGAINKRFEYMAAGLPQITSNGPGVPEIVDSPPCGILLDTLTTQTIANAINQLTENTELHQSMRQHGIEKYHSQYHYEKQFEDLKNQIMSWVSEKS